MLYGKNDFVSLELSIEAAQFELAKVPEAERETSSWKQELDLLMARYRRMMRGEARRKNCRTMTATRRRRIQRAVSQMWQEGAIA